MIRDANFIALTVSSSCEKGDVITNKRIVLGAKCKYHPLIFFTENSLELKSVTNKTESNLDY